MWKQWRLYRLQSRERKPFQGQLMKSVNFFFPLETFEKFSCGMRIACPKQQESTEGKRNKQTFGSHMDSKLPVRKLRKFQSHCPTKHLLHCESIRKPRELGRKLRKEKAKSRNFLGGPVVKNLSSGAGNVGSILVTKLRSHMLWGN